MIAAAMNINVTGPVGAGGGLERLNIDWLEMFGYPAEAGGLLVSLLLGTFARAPAGTFFFTLV